MASAGLKKDDLAKFDLLHKQYLAIAQYSKNPNDEQAIETIAETYQKTGINCLKYLVSLKTMDEWHSLEDSQGSQLCAVLTGYDPKQRFSDQKRSSILSKKHNEFVHFVSEVDRIVLEKTSQDENHIGKRR